MKKQNKHIFVIITTIFICIFTLLINSACSSHLLDINPENTPETPEDTPENPQQPQPQPPLLPQPQARSDSSEE